MPAEAVQQGSLGELSSQLNTRTITEADPEAGQTASQREGRRGVLGALAAA